MLSNLLAADITSTIMIVVLLVAIVGLFVWSSYSNKKRQKQAQDMINGIKIGDKVKIIGGVCGYVAEIDDSENTFVLRTGMEGKDSYVKFDKGAIYQTAPANPVQEKPVAPVAEEKPAPAQKKTTKKSTKKTTGAKKEKPAEVVEEQPVEAVEEKPAE